MGWQTALRRSVHHPKSGLCNYLGQAPQPIMAGGDALHDWSEGDLRQHGMLHGMWQAPR